MGGLNPRCSEVSRRLFENFKGRVIVVRSRHAPKLVLAFYYPWYGNPQGSSHRWFHWNTPPGVSYEEIAAATDYPLLGPYDSWDERVVRSHIEMAKAAGIDGFICSWWGIRTFEDLAFERMLNVAEEEGFNLTIYYETVREMSTEQMVRELSYVAKKYANHPAFLKLDGRPVIFIYAVEAMDRDLKFWRRVLERVEVETGVKPIYVGDTYSISFLEVFEGLHTYNPIWIENHEEMYSHMSEAVKSYVPLTSDEAYRRMWCATVAPGYDDRKIRRPGSLVPRGGGEYYERTWRAALGSRPDIVLICTWNEWHEGTEIEPSREYGFSYVRMTRRFVEVFKNITLAEVVPPSLRLTLSEEDEVIEILLENVGEVPAVASHVYVSGATTLRIADPSDLHIYKLQVNSTTLIAYIPYIAPGERVLLRCNAVSDVVSVSVKSWSALGSQASVKASLKAEGRREEAISGYLLIMAAAIIAVIGALALALRALLRRRVA